MKIKVYEYETKRYMDIIHYELSYSGCKSFSKKELIVTFLEIERARIKLALEQLKDIEKMSEEL